MRVAHLLARYATFLRYCAVGATASGVFYGVANLSALLLQVDSMDSYSASAECMDCHATNAARNDKNNPSKKVDSNAFTQNAQNLETPQATNRQLQNVSEQAQDSRILELQIGVFQGSQGDKTSGLSTPRADEIHDFSPKAESSKKAQHSQTATLLGSLASFIFGYFAQMRLAFRTSARHSTMLPRYLALLALIAIYAQAITYLGTLLALSYYAISAFIALSVPVFSYPLQKFWVFASKGGGGELRRVGFGAKNSDCYARAAVTYPKYAPLHTLAKPYFYHPNPTASDSASKNTQSLDSSTTILESIISLESKAALESKKTAQSESLTASSFAPKNKQNAVFIAKILESKSENKQPAKTSHATLESKNLDSSFSPSLRGGGKATNEAIHKQSLDSIEQVDCHAIATALARNDSNSSAPYCHADKNACNDSVLDSSKTPSLSSRAFEKGVAIHNKIHKALPKALESIFAKLDSSSTALFSPILWHLDLALRPFMRLAHASSTSSINTSTKPMRHRASHISQPNFKEYA